ncbi:MAG: nucleic acid-binding protein [Deltaproteobacteria bacterium RBG_16_54_11]|jgi:tRNA(fMet)-specific endonuclease VapC|nr:MAG: nucleic acid-binding protein [Deltaproteobacteria bacterium RBG_16_54_11]
MSYLIDTDIIIYGIKGNSIVQGRFLQNEHIPKSISVITYGELLFGAKKSKNVEKNLAAVYRIKELFPICGIDKAVIETFSDIKAAMQKSGSPVDDMDLLIASTALTMNYTLVTSNEKHFRKIKGLRIENWSKE